MSCETCAPESENVVDRARVAHELERDSPGPRWRRAAGRRGRGPSRARGRSWSRPGAGRARARPRPPSGAGPPRCRTRRASRSRPAAPRCRAAWRPSRSLEASTSWRRSSGSRSLRLLLVERQRAELLPHRQPVERQLGLEREQRGERAAVHLREHAPARGGGLVEQVQVRAARRPGASAPAEHAERDRPPALDGEVAQPHVVVAQARDRRRCGPRLRRRARRCPRSARP